MAGSKPTPERLDRLPQWAQEYIEDLRRDLHYQINRAIDAERAAGIKRLTQPIMDSAPVLISPLRGGDRDYPMADTTSVYWRPTANYQDQIQTHIEGRDLVVIGHRPIEVRPQSSNVLRVRCEAR